MEKFTIHSGTAVPLRFSNVDTDQIISSKHLKRIARTGYADALFEEWRKDPEFVINNPQYAGASILIAGPHFGIGSSREHAVWALMDYGFKVVISAQFADIFRGNSGKAGLLTIQVDQDAVESMWALVEAEPSLKIDVDLFELRIRCAKLEIPFQINEYVRWRFLEGLDDIDITLSHGDEIVAFAKSRHNWLPSLQ